MIYVGKYSFYQNRKRIYIICLINIIKSEVWTITHCLRLGHETMVCAVCLSIFLWICDMAGLLRGTFVSWWYLPRIWPSVTDMQHYYHARYPTDDWHLAYMFSFVYFTVEVWKTCFHILLAQGKIPASGPMPPPPHEKNKNKIEQGWLSSPLEPSEGAFELTHGSACIIGWESGLSDNLISTYFTQFMWFVIGRIHYGLIVVFGFIHITAFHYHHCARQHTGTEYI